MIKQKEKLDSDNAYDLKKFLLASAIFRFFHGIACLIQVLAGMIASLL